MSMERIVRPFITGVTPFDARRLAPEPDRVTNDPTMTWGGPNSGTYTQFQVSGIIGGQVNYQEKSRVTETVRVENPDDANQFVEVERIRELVMASEKGEQITFKMNS